VLLPWLSLLDLVATGDEEGMDAAAAHFADF
jgi:hypothetical protein